jgi:hypothetical protein
MMFDEKMGKIAKGEREKKRKKREREKNRK